MAIKRMVFKCSGESFSNNPVALVEAADPNDRELEEQIYFSSRSNIKLKTRINE